MSKPYVGENAIIAVIKNIKNRFVNKEELENFGGTVEITSEAPAKNGTVLTVNPEAEEINVYSAEEVDALVSVERARIDQFVALEEGSTTGDAELIDARIDKDGVTHANVGDHIRSITSRLSGQISQYGIYVGDTQPTNGVMYWLDTSEDSTGEVEPDIPDIPDTPVTYTITRNLTNCKSSKSVTTVTKGTSHTETITANSGYTLTGATVSVTMGGTNISSSYSNGVLNIASVTGNIVITVSAVAENSSEGDSIYTIPVEYTNHDSGGTVKWYSDAGETANNNILGAYVYVDTAFEKDTRIQIKFTLANTNYSTMRIGSKVVGELSAHYAESIAKSTTYYDAGTEYVYEYTVRAGYGLMIQIINSSATLSIMREDNGSIPDTPDIPEVTLSSISATYAGGDVLVGTSVNSLTGITVKAIYSDGSTANVTGYVLSGTIAEGSNTITVTYDGLTTTFTVTGVAETVAFPSEKWLENCSAIDKTYDAITTSYDKETIPTVKIDHTKLDTLPDKVYVLTNALSGASYVTQGSYGTFGYGTKSWGRTTVTNSGSFVSYTNNIGCYVCLVIDVAVLREWDYSDLRSGETLTTPFGTGASKWDAPQIFITDQEITKDKLKELVGDM